MNKNFRIISKKLKNAGFVPRGNGNHVIFEKDGITICVTKNIRDPNKLYKKALGQWEQKMKQSAE